MPDGLLIATRLALYADLGLLFGVPLFALQAVKGQHRRMLPMGRLSMVLAMIGIVLSLFGFALLAAAMSGTTLRALDPSMVGILITQTNVGWALLGRLATLMLALATVLIRPLRLWLLALFGGIAVTTLAWSGHAASSEGIAGVVHLGADILHLLAASAWIGALAIFLMLVSPQRAWPGRIEAAQAALAGFGTVGTVVVGLIVATGIVNGLFVVGADKVFLLGGSLYGRLLLAKLLLFTGMLICAALNRFRLTPGLADAIAQGDTGQAQAALRRSLIVEASLAIVILGLVGWLGTLEPPMSSM